MFSSDLDDEFLRANPIASTKPSQQYYFDFDDRCIRAKGTDIGIFDQLEVLAIIAGFEAEVDSLRAREKKLVDKMSRRAHKYRKLEGELEILQTSYDLLYEAHQQERK